MSNKTFCSIYFQIRLYMDVVLKVQFSTYCVVARDGFRGEFKKSTPYFTSAKYKTCHGFNILLYNTASTCIKTICKQLVLIIVLLLSNRDHQLYSYNVYLVL